MNSSAGWKEIDHTADRAICAWAPDLSDLFRQAALGMYGLLDIRPCFLAAEKRDISLQAFEPEVLLVRFLSALLTSLEEEKLAFSMEDLQVSDNKIEAGLAGCRVENIRITIKAVTYHDLHIEKTPEGYQTTVVFDV